MATYEKYHALGFEILGIASNDTREKVQAFIGDKKMPWAQTLDGEKGPIVTLFRVIGWPSYFLIGQDGLIAVAAPDGAKFDLRAELAKLLPAK